MLLWFSRWDFDIKETTTILLLFWIKDDFSWQDRHCMIVLYTNQIKLQLEITQLLYVTCDLKTAHMHVYLIFCLEFLSIGGTQIAMINISNMYEQNRFRKKIKIIFWTIYWLIGSRIKKLSSENEGEQYIP